MPPRNSSQRPFPHAEPLGRLALALTRAADANGPIVHVAASPLRARRLAATAQALVSQARIVHFPAWDCFPYDRMPPSKACMGARMGVLRRLTDRATRPSLVVTTPGAILRRVPP